MSHTPHLSPKAAGLQPVETHEVVAAAADLLRAHAGFMAHLRPAGSLHVQRLPLHAPAGPDQAEAESAPLWALLREMKPVGPTSARPSIAGVVTVRMQLQLSLDPTADAPDPDQVLSYGHVLAYDALQDEPLAVDVAGESGAAASAYSVRQTGGPSPAADDGHGRLYSSAYYAVTVYPTAPSVAPPAP